MFRMTSFKYAVINHKQSEKRKKERALNSALAKLFAEQINDNDFTILNETQRLWMFKPDPGQVLIIAAWLAVQQIAQLKFN